MALPKNVTGYRFLDKDPSIDLYRHALDKAYPGMSRMKRHERSRIMHRISEGSGVSIETLRRWDFGETKKPHNITMRFVMAELDYEQVYIDKEGHILKANYTNPEGNVVRLRRRVS